MDGEISGDNWFQTKTRRAHREYTSFQKMMDDIWGAHEHGWLPLSMTEKSQSQARWTAPRTWFRKQVTYVVTYRHRQR
jgi:hypothetical protein